MRKDIIITLIIISIGLIVGLSLYVFYNIFNKSNDLLDLDESKFSIVEDECTQIAEFYEKEKLNESISVISTKFDDVSEEFYVVRIKDEFIVIYKINQNNEESFFKSTNISSKYLTETDLINLNEGIQVKRKKRIK